MKLKRIARVKEGVELKRYFVGFDVRDIVSKDQAFFLKQLRYEVDYCKFSDYLYLKAKTDKFELMLYLPSNNIEYEEFNLNSIWETTYENIA